ncbi:MAG TPA: hypothetical protein ENK46_09650 [Flavobacteriia bacterium]|nr:hypothetical protein [Flavobacteriia bacterium]
MFKKSFNLRLIKYLGIFYAIIAIVQALNSSYFKMKGYFPNYTWLDIWVYTVLSDWTTVMVYMIFVSYLTKKMHQKKLNINLIFIIHFFLSLLLNLVLMTSVLFKNFLVSGDIEKITKTISVNYFLSYIDITFLTYFSMLSIIYGYYYIKKIKTSENQKTKLQTQLVSIKMNMLKAQLHPHFVFNTLNSISSLITVDKEKSQVLITNFIDLFKGILKTKEELLIPVQRELNLLDKYISIIIERFSDHLTIQKNIDVNTLEVLIPNMLLQPLLENAIKHGYSYENTKLIIKLSIYKNADYLIILIENNGQLLKNEFYQLLKKGIGLKNTQERLHNLFGGNFEFIVKNNNDNSGVITFIKIPYQTLKKS